MCIYSEDFISLTDGYLMVHCQSKIYTRIILPSDCVHLMVLIDLDSFDNFNISPYPKSFDDHG